MSKKPSDKYLLKQIGELRESAIEHRSNNKPGYRRYWMYGYLKNVYEVFLEFNSRGISKSAGRRLIKLLQLPIKRKSHVLRVLVEATAAGEERRTKIKWANALRYAHGWLQRPERLKWFFGVSGGIAGCAGKFAFLQKKRREKKLAIPPISSASVTEIEELTCCDSGAGITTARTLLPSIRVAN